MAELTWIDDDNCTVTVLDDGHDIEFVVSRTPRTGKPPMTGEQRRAAWEAHCDMLESLEDEHAEQIAEDVRLLNERYEEQRGRPR